MKNRNLPETYKGYLTKELLAMWSPGEGLKIAPGTPRDKIAAIGGLLREYKLAPVFWDEVHKGMSRWDEATQRVVRVEQANPSSSSSSWRSGGKTFRET